MGSPVKIKLVSSGIHKRRVAAAGRQRQTNFQFCVSVVFANKAPRINIASGVFKAAVIVRTSVITGGRDNGVK